MASADTQNERTTEQTPFAAEASHENNLEVPQKRKSRPNPTNQMEHFYVGKKS